MPQPEGAELEQVRERRDEIRRRHLKDPADRPPGPTRGVHHAAFVCRDVEETIRFHQDLLGFPLVELVENRDYAGSSHFFFDLGHGNLLGFFDFPGHDHAPFSETVGALQHLALSTPADDFDRLKATFEAEGIDYLGPDRGVEDSLYIQDPNGLRIEFYREDLGRFEGEHLVDAD